MRRTIRISMALAILSSALFAGSGAFAYPCQGEPVNPGDTPEEVSAKCGEPMLKETRVISVKETEGKATRKQVTNIEEWTFNAGPTVLMQSVRFENGKVAEIGSPGYGPVRDFSVDNCRNGELLAVGDSMLDAYMKCGEPIAKEKKADQVIDSREGSVKRQTTLSVAEWTYRYGPNAPGYTMRFENGKAVSIRTREFGK